MKKLKSYLTENPIIVLIMFIISLVGGIMGIILGWNQFYTDYLSVKVQLPIWVLFSILIVSLLLFLFISKKSNKATKELETIEGQKFGVQKIELDGKRFVNCSFDGSELVFKGINTFSLEQNNFKTPPRFMFESHAGTTVLALKALHGSPSFKKNVDNLFGIK